MSYDLAWAAGFMDGEGCIYIAYRTTQDQYVLTVSVANTHLSSLERFKAIVGVGRIHSARQQREPHHKPLFMWSASSKQAETMLRLLLPFLVTKQEQAKVGLYSRQFIGPRGGRRPEQIGPDREQLAWLKNRLTELKAV